MSDYVTDQKTSELAKKTLETLKQYGWAQGKLGNCRDGMCILGAAYHAATGKEPGDQISSFDVCDIVPDMVSAMYRKLNTGRILSDRAAVTEWNDDPKRKFTEVEELLEKISNEQ